MRSVLLRAFACLLLMTAPAVAEDAKPAATGFDFSVDRPLKLLFAQTAKAMRYDGETLVLEGLTPATLFFSDRPERLTGHLSTADFVELWGHNADSFAADPPNAALVLLEEEGKPPPVVELIGVSYQDRALHYRVRVLEGEIPATSGAVSLFIDPWVWVPREDSEWVRCFWNRWGRYICHKNWD
ncbi:MAG: hypothetical protein Kilf2KO_28630 [Rhodospirillales bacterium]